MLYWGVFELGCVIGDWGSVIWILNVKICICDKEENKNIYICVLLEWNKKYYVK